MKLFRNFLLLILLASGVNAQNINFKHDWDIKYLEHDIKFTSKKKAPIPFSTTGEPQAIMIIGASVLDKSANTDLQEIVKDEINGIRQEINLDEYLEDDYKANDNIVSYIDKINDVQIAVIKYRTNGVLGGQRTMTRNARQILFVYNNKLWISTLIVLFGEDQENMRSDQMTFIKAIINKK